MAQVGRHDNLVSLVGVVTAGPPLLLLLTYCEHGSLLSYLKKAAKNAAVVPIHTKYKMAADVARGMEHLSAAGFIHRDLAARNVLVASNFSCKVADFGLSRASAKSASAPAVEDENGEDASDGGDYYRSKNGVFPIKWTAPEAMEALKFTHASDTWSFGIVLVEIVQDGAGPYAKWNTNLIMMKVIGGFKHAQPSGCPDVLYKVILDCLATDPTARPSFGALVERLQQLMTSDTESDGRGASGAVAGGIAETNIDHAYLAPVVNPQFSEPAEYMAVDALPLGAGSGRAQYLAVNAGHAGNPQSKSKSKGGAGQSGAERCSRCNTKLQFCVCNVRRNTADMSSSQRVKKPNGKARAAHAGAQQQHQNRKPQLRARSGTGTNRNNPSMVPASPSPSHQADSKLHYIAGLDAVAPASDANSSAGVGNKLHYIAGLDAVALPKPAATSQYMTGLPTLENNAAAESHGGGGSARDRPQAGEAEVNTPSAGGGGGGGGGVDGDAAGEYTGLDQQRSEYTTGVAFNASEESVL